MNNRDVSPKSGYTDCPIVKNYDNLSQEVIRVTKDKLKLALMEHLTHVDAKFRWIKPLGFSTTILLALLTTDFKDRFYLEKTLWQGMFIIIFLIGIGWFIGELIRLRKSISIDRLIEIIKTPLEDESK